MQLNDKTEKLIKLVIKRDSFLTCLRENQKDKRTLVAELDYSRSTVDRGIRDLEAAGLVQYKNGGYQLTSLGASIMDGFVEFVEASEQRVRLDPFLRWIDEDALDLDYSYLADAEIIAADPGDPYAVINYHVSRIESMYNGRFLLPIIGLHGTEVIYERIINHGATCELVVEPDVMNTIQSKDEYLEYFEEMIATDRLTIYRTETNLSPPVGIINDCVQLLAVDGDLPRTLIETSHSQVYEWATDTFEAYKQQAELVMASDMGITTS
ncbi:helix-turn-helix transcriptional regulator [Candidatus Halobonum tyrrellensis]|nr:hypothetical protein [Candidatus Halobonum tyrrellensis]